MWKIVIILCAALGSCSDFHRAWLPTEAETATVILVRRQGGPVILDVISATDPSTPVSPSDEEAYALLYDEHPLELPFGRVEPSLDPNAPDLPTPNQRYVLERETQRWVPAEQTPAWVSQIRVPAPKIACRSFERTPLFDFGAYKGPLHPSFVRFADNRVLAWSDDSDFFEVTTSTVVELNLAGLSGLDEQIVTGVYRSGDDEVFLMGASGSMFRGHPDRGFERGPSVPVAETSAWIHAGSAVSPSPEPLELYFAHCRYGLWRFADEMWSQIAEVEAPVPTHDRPLVLLTGPQTGIATGLRQGYVTSFRAGGSKEQAPIVDPSDSVESLVDLPGLGAFAGSQEGSLRRRDALGEWSLVGQRHGGSIESILLLGTHLLVGGERSTFVELDPNSDRYCDPVSIGDSSLDAPALLQLGDALVMFESQRHVDFGLWHRVSVVEASP